MMQVEEEKRAERIRAWRDSVVAFAQFLLDHPDFPEPGAVTMPEIYPINVFVHDVAEFRSAARQFTPFEKKVAGVYYALRRRFGVVPVELYTLRSAVCRRVVVGTKEIPARVEPAEVVEIVEWVCDDPVLAEPTPESSHASA